VHIASCPQAKNDKNRGTDQDAEIAKGKGAEHPRPILGDTARRYQNPPAADNLNTLGHPKREKLGETIEINQNNSGTQCSSIRKQIEKEDDLRRRLTGGKKSYIFEAPEYRGVAALNLMGKRGGRA